MGKRCRIDSGGGIFSEKILKLEGKCNVKQSTGTLRALLSEKGIGQNGEGYCERSSVYEASPGNDSEAMAKSKTCFPICLANI